MKKTIRYFMLIIGCFLVAFGIDYFFLPNNLLGFGIDGISILLNKYLCFNIAFVMVGLNLIGILFSTIWFKKAEYEKYILPSLLIPVFVYLLSNVYEWYPIVLPEFILNVLVGSFLVGTGYSIIYKQGFAAGITLLIEELICFATKFHSKVYSYIIDVIISIIYVITDGYIIGLYSALNIFIIRYMVKKVKFGISNSKMFYIITSKEKEVNNFIIHDLHGELSVLESKGGYTNKENKILLCVIDTHNYFKLKEGIKKIDEKAFIAITDTYDVVNHHSFKN